METLGRRKERKKTPTTKQVCTFHILCVGLNGIGKRSLVTRFTKGYYDEVNINNNLIINFKYTNF